MALAGRAALAALRHCGRAGRGRVAQRIRRRAQHHRALRSQNPRPTWQSFAQTNSSMRWFPKANPRQRLSISFARWIDRRHRNLPHGTVRSCDRLCTRSALPFCRVKPPPARGEGDVIWQDHIITSAHARSRARPAPRCAMTGSEATGGRLLILATAKVLTKVSAVHAAM
jgi:hypothetical protein